MSFLKKKIANANHSSHSRMSSVSSTKVQASNSISSNKSSGKPPALPPKLPIDHVPVIETNSDTTRPENRVSKIQEDSMQDQNDSGFSFEEGVSLQYASNELVNGGSNTNAHNVPESKRAHLLDEEQPLLNTSSRKPSGGSVTSLSLDKLLCSWDVTDPEEWTMVRVIAWFRFNEFSDTWINYFKRHQIYGDKFLKLMALDNFVRHQKFLPQSQNSSYNRFQYLLKRTLEKNVGNGHIRNKSDKSSGSRSSSDSLKLKKKKSRDIDHSRSTSESVLTDNRKVGADILEDKNISLRSHQKANSASSLYRRSFISLRGSSVSNVPKAENNININIPQAALSTIDSSSQLCPSNSRSTPSPLSPSYVGIFRRQHKSSSSESSIFNTLFGSSSGSNQNSNSAEGNQSQVSHHSASLENLPKNKPGREGSSSSPLKQSPIGVEDKSKRWDKLKKKEVHSEVLAPTIVKDNRDDSKVPGEISTDQKETISQQEETPKFDWKEFVLEKKFYPLKTSSVEDRFILITKDNRSFVPLNINMITNKDELKDSMALTLGITHKNFTIHLTDFGCDIGCVIPDDLLESMRENMFYNLPGKFYIKDQMKIQLRPRTGTISNDVPNSLRSVKSKGSVKSGASSVINSNDDTSIATSCSDVNSFDDSAHGAGRSAYPQTPSYYYDTGNSNTNVEVDYWNFKEAVHDEAQASKLPQIRSRSNSKLKRVPESTSHPVPSPGDMSTFKVIRKASENEIDFDKRRESPYVSSDFAPRREAPKPPSGSQLSLDSLSSQGTNQNNSPPRLQRKRAGTYVKRKPRPPPPMPVIPKVSSRSSSFGSAIQVKHSSSSPVESVVHSYTPGLTQVLVPQPYKGATEMGKGSKVEDILANPISAYIHNQRANRSNSVHSAGATIHPSPPKLLRKASSKRVISSASAADVFFENEISFADAPNLSESDNEESESGSSDEIIWSAETKKDNTSNSSDEIIWTPNAQKDRVSAVAVPTIKLQDPDGIRNDEKETEHDQMEDSTDFDTLSAKSSQNGLSRKMTLRPSPEVVYQNLEKFFPGTDLDKPIVEGVTPPSSPKCIERYSPDLQTILKDKSDSEILSPVTSRTGTPQTMISKSQEVPQEVLTPVSRSLKPPKRTKTIRIIAREASEARRDSQASRLKRKNTKMWGTKVVEVTDKRMVAINKAKNSNGEYKEFAWIKGDMIGKGSFGSVFLGLNVTTGEMMAVKQVEVPKYGSQDETTLSVLEALRSEVSTLKDLDHLNIVQYLGFENKNCIYSLFLEYVAGGSVGSLIRLYGRFDDNLIRFLTVQVLQGLSYLHSRGILHRDMKADNLLLDLDGVCKISDFGISKKSKNIYSNSDMTMRGTVFWMAPEMVDTKQGYSAKVDIWSLGCVVLEMFAGKRPWSNFEVVAAMFQIGKSKAAPPIPDDTLPLISTEGREFLDACFEIDPEKRPTADTLLLHAFCDVDDSFIFSRTDLARFIKSNDRVNSSKLRVSSQESSIK